MGKKILVVKSEACRGCRVCVLAWTRKKLGAISLAEAPIRIQSDGEKFIISVDAGLNEEDQKTLSDACVRHCFEGHDEN